MNSKNEKKEINIVWRPQKGSQQLYLSCPIYEVLYDGTRGSQKTDSIIMDFAQDVGKGYGQAWRGLIFRRTYKQLDDIVIRTKKWFYLIFPGAKYNESKFVWTFPTGEQLLLRHMDNPDDYWNYHGHEYPFIAWEELTGWPDDKCYDAMKSCCRSSHPDVPRKYRATTNPWGIGMNWVKQYFIDPAPPGTIIENEGGEKRVRIHGSILENTALLKADPEYIKKLDSIKDPNKRKAWRDGSWDITAGGALDDVWDGVRHVLEPFEIPHTFYIDRSFDWGSAKPFSVDWWAESDGSDVVLANGKSRSFPKGTVFHIYEYYGWNGTENEGCRMLASEIAQEIRTIEDSIKFKEIVGNNAVHKGPADTSIFDEENNMCIAADMRREGITWTRANKKPGSRKQGLEKLRRFLKNSRALPIEKPGLLIFSNCRHFIRTVPTLPRDKRNIEDVACFVAGTMISTPSGRVPIEDVKEGDFVSTPIGPRIVERAGLSGRSKTMKITLLDGSSLRGTPNHKVVEKKHGLLPLNRLLSGDELIQEGDELCLKLSQSFMKELCLRNTQKDDISSVTQARKICLMVRLYCTGLFGKMREALSKMVYLFTTRIISQPTIELKTSNLSKKANTLNTITRSGLKMETISKKQAKHLLKQKKGLKYADELLSYAVRDLPYANLRALIVENLLKLDTRLNSTAVKNAKKKCQGLSKNVRSAEKNSEPKRIQRKKSKPVVINVGGLSEDKTNVYNLMVRQAHLFFANGLLVTNTEAEDHIYDSCRYRLLLKRYKTREQEKYR